MSLPGFQQLSPDVCVAGQLDPAAMDWAAKAGFKSIINNRPDFEGGPDQPTSASIEAAAHRAGLRYAHAVTRIYPTLQNVPGDRAINRARVHVDKPEPPRKVSRNAAFPRGSRPINGNDAMKTLAHARIIALELT